MTVELAAHDIAKTVLCKTEDCANEAPARGRHAGLCDECRRARRVDLSIAGAAKGVLAAAYDLDFALARRHAAPQEARAAVAAFKTELAKLRATVRSACT